ncbi:hypothetical protein Dsin_023882 [Dipteronia sinensis]|uniref:Secreted protein n=1 Tax=Dipteronia sinensis TaxID=43782 RepID=A0AAE0A539_9ROSI|nr:hypothetical protein Dsin_023882 [Dipteronia sinensis]
MCWPLTPLLHRSCRVRTAMLLSLLISQLLASRRIAALELVPGRVQKCIFKPVEDNSRWTRFLRAPNVMTPHQLLRGKNLNFGASTAASQPAFGSAEQNYSSSTSVPGNQLHQQNPNKRPRHN